MMPASSPNLSGDNSGGASPVLLSAVALAALSVVCLALVVAINLSGGMAWAVLSWIPMIGLPVAFLLMLALVIAAVRRRRQG